MSRIICVDFDGVIHSYEKGWNDGGIYGTVVRGFFGWAGEAKANGFKVMIYSSRSKTPEGIEAMRSFLRTAYDAYAKNNLISTNPNTKFLFEDLGIDFASEKPPAFLTIDDRCMRFNGNWNDPRWSPHNLKNYKTWVEQAKEKKPEEVYPIYQINTFSGWHDISEEMYMALTKVPGANASFFRVVNGVRLSADDAEEQCAVELGSDLDYQTCARNGTWESVAKNVYDSDYARFPEDTRILKVVQNGKHRRGHSTKSSQERIG